MFCAHLEFVKVSAIMRFVKMKIETVIVLIFSIVGLLWISAVEEKKEKNAK
jgi:hypothetical protein